MSIQAISINVISDTEIQVVAPSGLSGVVDVTVTNPDGGTYTFPAAFTFISSPLPSGQGLLSGCVVNPGGTPSCGVPAGWTLVNAVDFEGGDIGVGASFNSATVDCSFSHSGSCSATHRISQGDDTGEWHSQTIIGSKDVYISWWEFDEANGSMQTDLGIAGVRWPSQTDSYWIDPNDPVNPTACNGGQYPSNIKLNRYLLIYGVGGFETFGASTNCMAPNAPTWGNWTQWEYRIKINDPTPWPNPANGEYQLYRNGALVANMPPFTGRTTNSGDPNANSNFVGSSNYDLYPHYAWVGGVSTFYSMYRDDAKTQCATAINGSDVRTGTIMGSFDNPCPCPNQCAPNGWALSTGPGGFRRWWDDIIVLAR